MRGRFPDTSWTLLAKAREQCEDGARARGNLAQKYYRSVQDFLLVLVQDAEKARELSQEFFITLSKPGGLLEHATPKKGRFRDFLQQALRYLVIDYYRRNRTEALQIHPDQANSEGWDVLELAQLPVAEAAFHYAWVKTTLAEALIQVRAICLKRKQQVHLELFEARYLCDTGVVPSWKELGTRYGMDQKAAHERADTVARHFRLVLRRMLRNEINVPDGVQVTEAAIDEEIRALLSPLKD
jgi:DNA-directed RNA polymerase specialized sigma24 family protein